jgi:hypothetical protein
MVRVFPLMVKSARGALAAEEGGVREYHMRYQAALGF